MVLSASQRQSYYADPAIRARLDEFFGTDSSGHATAVYFAPGTEWESFHRSPRSLEELPRWLDLGAELNRSLWDRKSLLAHLDIEYVNFDFPAYPYLETERIFDCQEPVARAVKSILGELGIIPLHLLTGRGHHFVWRLNLHSPAFEQLRRLGRMSDSLPCLYASTPGPVGELVSPELGAAFSGLGLIIEYLAHRIKVRAASECPLPVELAAIEAGGGAQGREIIAIDITEYADPLCSRVIRVPFSIYLKPWQLRHALGEETANRISPIFLIPVDGIEVQEGLKIRENAGFVRQLASRASTSIPEASPGMLSLVQNYLGSPLARFHEWFYSQEPQPKSAWPATYDQTPMDVMPPCVSHILSHPNDFLLRPGCAERVVRVMLSLGWLPRHVAGLIRSKYEHDHGWGDQWDGYDPATRADFYARVFSGLFVAGADELVDFNCKSAREEGLCFIEHCNENLTRFRDSLINRKKYERLACRPFNGLFLSNEHS